MAKWDNPIGIPFAENGDRTNIPDTSEDGNVNNTTGFGSKYEIDPAVGGLWLYRQTMNSLFYNMFSSIKEIQTKVPISVNGATPDASGNIPIIIPEADGAGIKVIDDNSPDITSFNQITKDGVYYIYKQLSDGPQQNEEAITYGYINLIVINVKFAGGAFNACMQATSFGLELYDVRPGNIGSMPMIRFYDKNILQWSPWESRPGIPFINNNIIISGLTGDKSATKFPIIATDDAFPDGYNTFMYSATREQMREQLGITGDGGGVEAWSTYTAPTYNTTDYTNTYNNISYCLFTKNINNIDYNMIKLKCILSYNNKDGSAYAYGVYAHLKIPLPQNINIYSDNIDLKNNVLSYIKHNCEMTSIKIFDDTNDTEFTLIGNSLIDIACIGGRMYVDIVAIALPYYLPTKSYNFLVEIEAFVEDRQSAPTPATIDVTKIIQDQITLTYTRG